MEGNVASASGQPEMADTVDPAHASSHAATETTTPGVDASMPAAVADAAAPVADADASAAAPAADSNLAPGSAPSPGPASAAAEPTPYQHPDQVSTASAATAPAATPSPPPPAATTSPAPAPSPAPAQGHERQPYQHHHHQKSLPERPVPHFVAPSSYLRPKTVTRSAMSAVSEPKPPSPLDKEQRQGLVRLVLPRRCLAR